MLKKFLCSILSLMILVSTPVVVMADTVDETDTASMNWPDSIQENDIIPNLQEELSLGDIQILKQDDEEIFYVQVTDEAQSVSRSGEQTKSKTYTYYRSILGFEQKLFSVQLECRWIKNGANSRIINLHGKYTTYASDVRCSWDDRFKEATDIFHKLALDYEYAGSNSTIFFYASLAYDYSGNLIIQASTEL